MSEPRNIYRSAAALLDLLRDGKTVTGGPATDADTISWPEFIGDSVGTVRDHVHVLKRYLRRHHPRLVIIAELRRIETAARSVNCAFYHLGRIEDVRGGEQLPLFGDC